MGDRLGRERAASDRIDALTGVRIIAAGSVFLSHAAVAACVPRSMRTVMSAGYNGVTLFFVLSGFVLAWNYAERMVPLRGRELWSFAVARFARIYPLYAYAFLCAGVILIGSPESRKLPWMHLLAIQTWHPDVSVAYSFNGPGWSIGVEFFLYACFPAVIIALARIRRSRPALLAVIGICLIVMFMLAWWFVATGRAALPGSDPGSAHRWLYRMPLTRLGDFVIGVAAAMLIRNTAPANPNVARVAQVLGAVGIIALMAWPSMYRTAWSWDAAYALPDVLLVWGLAAAPGTACARVLGCRPLVMAGEASFALYLLHAPLLYVMRSMNVGEAATLVKWLCMIGFQFSVVMLLAFGAHTVIERPAQRWIRRRLSPVRRSERPCYSTHCFVEVGENAAVDHGRR